MKALVVGAGAVGQVFGCHLAKGGAAVTFLVKPKYADMARSFTMYPLNGKGQDTFTGFDLITAPTAGFDQVYITVDSTALPGEWLPELVRATGDATLVFLQPNLRDAELIDAVVPDRARVVIGAIGFLSYHAPLPGETRFAEPGMAYWFPPGKSPFSGERADAVVASLRAGKLPAKRVRDVRRQAAFPSAVLTTFVTALEASGWSFGSLKADLGARAVREAVRVAGHELGTGTPIAVRMATRPLALRAIIGVAAKVVPVDLETYMRVHFTKVSAQMHESLATYVERGRAAGLPTGALEDLTRMLPAAR